MIKKGQIFISKEGNKYEIRCVLKDSVEIYSMKTGNLFTMSMADIKEHLKQKEEKNV